MLSSEEKFYLLTINQLWCSSGSEMQLDVCLDSFIRMYCFLCRLADDYFVVT